MASTSASAPQQLSGPLGRLSPGQKTFPGLVAVAFIESLGPDCSMGDVCIVKSGDGEDVCVSEEVGFRDNRVLSMILGDASRVGPGGEVVATDHPFSVVIGNELFGRVIDWPERPSDRKGPTATMEVHGIRASQVFVQSTPCSYVEDLMILGIDQVLTIAESRLSHTRVLA